MCPPLAERRGGGDIALSCTTCGARSLISPNCDEHVDFTSTRGVPSAGVHSAKKKRAELLNGSEIAECGVHSAQNLHAELPSNGCPEPTRYGRKTHRTDNLRSRSGSMRSSDSRFRRESPGFHEGLLPRLFGLCSSEGGLQRESVLPWGWRLLGASHPLACCHHFGRLRRVPHLLWDAHRRIIWYWTYCRFTASSSGHVACFVPLRIGRIDGNISCYWAYGRQLKFLINA